MRNEDFDRELLVAVTLICAAPAAAVSLFEATASAGKAAAQAPQRIEQLTPVRTVGTPFVPNTNPSVR